MVKVTAYAKFDWIPSIRSQDIEQKWNPQPRAITAVDLQKWMCNNPKLDPANATKYEKFGLILLIRSQDIEWKRTRTDNHGP